MVEALFCGTPVITSDWGGFAENNLHGVTGYRCRTMEQFEWACKNVDKISRKACYEWAMNNFSLERVALMYEEYFETLTKVHDGSVGFYATNSTRTNLDWLVRYYPKSQEQPSPSEDPEMSQSCDIPQFQPKSETDSADTTLAILSVS